MRMGARLSCVALMQLSREDAELDFHSATATQLHNRVRAFAGWPGTSGRFLVRDNTTGASTKGGVLQAP
jgi:hypothetical protein